MMNIGDDVCRRVAQKTGGEIKYEGGVCKVELPDAEILVYEDGRGRIKAKVDDPGRAVQIADQYTRVFREVYLELGLLKQ